MNGSVRVCLVSASCQNVFFAEILDAFGEALRENGVPVEESIDCFPPPQDDLVNLFIPHEYFPLVDELAHPNTEQLARTVTICTEQPGTEWFEMTSSVTGRAGAAVDINELGARELRRRGVAAHYIPIGYVPSWDHWGGAERERSIEMVFLGGYTERRASTLARCSPVLNRRRAAIYLTETISPHRAGSPYFLAYDRKWELMADSKTILNVHRDELPYFEWHRVLGAVLNGCVVVSEHSGATEPMEVGEHFVSGRVEDLPAILGGLLEDPERLARIRDSAYRLVREQIPLREGVGPLLEEIERVAVRGGATPPTPAAVPMPRPLAPRPPEWELLGHHFGDELSVRMALKHVVVKMHGLERRLAELDGSAAPDVDQVDRLGPELERPQISVLLTVHNYADHVGEALRSVALAEQPEVEVVAVDDASSDDSVEAVRRASERHPWLPITHVRRARNHGLPAARNLALAHSRSELVFILDADNRVRPRGLARLREALEERPDAAFAYGLIECFDAGGPNDVLNWIDWDPARLRHGNYIDAMAMIRRAALEEVGGYPEDPVLLGLEDFAVWVAMASAGHDGVRVPDFVACYRRSPHSMLSLTSIDTSAAWATLLRRYPRLAERSGFGRVLDAEADPAAANGDGRAPSAVAAERSAAS